MSCTNWCEGYGSVIPDAPGAESHPLTQSLAEKVGKFVKEYVEAMEKVRNIIWTLVWYGYLSLFLVVYVLTKDCSFDIG